MIVKVTFIDSSVRNVRQKVSWFNSCWRIFYPSGSVFNSTSIHNFVFSLLREILFFFLTLLLSSFCLSLCPPCCCCTVGCVLLILDLPLLRSSVIICWNCLLTPPSTNEFFSSISRLLLTKLKSELTLTIERVIDCLLCILLVTKEVKWVSLLFC